MEIPGGDTRATARVQSGFLFVCHTPEPLPSPPWLLDVLPQLSATPPCLQIQLLCYLGFHTHFVTLCTTPPLIGAVN